MIVCEEKQWVFIRNPRTASRSIAKFLFSNFRCTETLPVHRVSIPPQYLEFDAYTVIRNPIERAISFWLSAPGTLSAHKGIANIPPLCKYDDFVKIENMSFTDFVKNKTAMLPCEIKDGDDFLFDPNVFDSERVIEFEGSEYKLKVFNFFSQSEMIRRIGSNKLTTIRFSNLHNEIANVFGGVFDNFIGKSLYDRRAIPGFEGLRQFFEEDFSLCLD